MHLFGIALAALIGLSLGLLGGGGSILTVPILVYVIGMDAKEAIAASLLVVGTTSALAAVSHWRVGHVRPRTALGFGLIAMGGAYAGARLAAHVAGQVQLAIFAVVMLGVAASMFRGGRDVVRLEHEPPPPSPWLLTTFAALAVGGLTGMVGIGGGFLIVPALVLLARLPMREAIGTSLPVIAMNAAAGFSGYVGYVHVAWGFLSVFTAVAVLGALAGARWARHIPQPALRRAFAVFLVLMGTLILYQNRAVLLPEVRATPAETRSEP